jgi:hypothetical protein
MEVPVSQDLCLQHVRYRGYIPQQTGYQGISILVVSGTLRQRQDFLNIHNVYAYELLPIQCVHNLDCVLSPVVASCFFDGGLCDESILFKYYLGI